MITDEEKQLHVSDLLLLNKRQTKKSTSFDNRIPQSSPFTDLIRKPRNIDQLYKKIKKYFKTRWSEFLYSNDSLELPDMDRKDAQNLKQLLSILIVLVATVYTDFKKSVSKLSHNNDPQKKLKILIDLWKVRSLKLADKLIVSNYLRTSTISFFRMNIRSAIYQEN